MYQYAVVQARSPGQTTGAFHWWIRVRTPSGTWVTTGRPFSCRREAETQARARLHAWGLSS